MNTATIVQKLWNNCNALRTTRNVAIARAALCIKRAKYSPLPQKPPHTHHPVSPTLFGNVVRGVGANQQGAQVVIFWHAFGHAKAGGNGDGFAVVFELLVLDRVTVFAIREQRIKRKSRQFSILEMKILTTTAP